MFKRIGRFALAGMLVIGGFTGIVKSVETQASAASGFYHTVGNRIVDASGNPAVLNGINWFGFETSNYSPHGIWARSMDSLLDQIKENGYNLIRLPYCNEMFDSTAKVAGVDWVKNPDLVGLTPIQVMDKLVEKAGARGMKIFLDRHRPDSNSQSNLWYTAKYSEQRWIDDWKMLAARYADNPTVIGGDLHNEPHGEATWGTGDLATDWRLAAEKAGNAILSVNPNWLIIVEGIDSKVQGETGGYWWGGNLKGVKNYPVRLNVPNRIVYSSHDYGPGVADQTWFHDGSFPSNMPAIWDQYWGYISKQNLAPVIVGEFGGRSVDTTSVEGKWQNALVDYIKANDLYWTYWCVNPNSGDTGGLLLDDWQTWNREKQAMLNRMMKPLPTATASPSPTATSTPTPTATPTPSATPILTPTPTGSPTPTSTSTVTPTSSATPSSTPASGLIVQYKAGDTSASDNQIKPFFNIKNTGGTGVKLSELTLRYYFSKDGNAGMSSWIDWAAIGGTHITRTFTDTYVEVGFTAGAGSLQAGEQTGDIQLRLAKTDWSNFDEANDYSYKGTLTTYTDWSKVTLYQAGKLVWGIEP
ncbi:cellulase family glycosylhydrolase [Gorillibacterium timonense]|uniref:cellulase family glycosylhydrolase n=1 Tax=Gorillibacterium timonense TaxID=1689269 RepID=UPI0009E9DB91|nr:cellulase family glycosylhydrolase [Gorillibacterium timonense]